MSFDEAATWDLSFMSWKPPWISEPSWIDRTDMAATASKKEFCLGNERLVKIEAIKSDSE